MTLKERDKKYLWHPLTQHQLQKENIAIVKAKDCLLYDEDGNTYIDAIASWYTCMYGHCNPFILEQLQIQSQQLHHTVFSGFTHEPAIELSEQLIEILPSNQSKLFFSDNGSTTIDVAIKMALQYHFNQGENRNVLLAFEDGFHGDTFGAMSVSGLSVYNGPFEDYFLDVVRIPTPNGSNAIEILAQLESLVSHHKVAAFVYEPLVQGAAAMKMHNADSLNTILEFCATHNIITIADEVMTGFGKTGTYFASDQIPTQPDIMCLSKALTAGMMPMGITSCSQRIYNAFLSEDIAKGFFHGHTYSANPLACAAAIAGIKLLTSKEIQDNIERIVNSHLAFDSRIKSHPKIASTRQLGVIYALDLNLETERYGDFRDRLFRFFLERGVFLRPLGNTIYIQAPYIITTEELDVVYAAIEDVLDTL